MSGTSSDSGGFEGKFHEIREHQSSPRLSSSAWNSAWDLGDVEASKAASVPLAGYLKGSRKLSLTEHKSQPCGHSSPSCGVKGP